MVFSSTVFLFIFLPVVLFLNFLIAPLYRNVFLLIVSLFFYAWGEGMVVLLMLFLSCINYVAGLGVDRYRHRDGIVRIILTVAIIVNLAFLFYYKYFTFVIKAIPFINSANFDDMVIVLPIGISFYTFHGISYVVDIYRKNIPALRNPFDVGLYIAFFPQLVAGPIVRYSDIAKQLKSRIVTIDLFYYGCIRFIRGLSKKLLIANTLGLVVDNAFGVSIDEMPTPVSWLAIICYSLQIYFDFSGYSDMAIGLAKMFGFNFKENFDHPYIATSIQDFWRRWHISLSSWFRDYVYIPLGGNQKGALRTYANLIIVFFVTGLWHGAGWNFIFWGLFHGFFLILERSKILNLDRFPVVLRHLYTLTIVLVAWVFFRSESFDAGIQFLKVMVGLTHGEDFRPFIQMDAYGVVVLLIGIVLATPIRERMQRWISRIQWVPYAQTLGAAFLYLFLFTISVMQLAQSSYNPFIYFRF